MKFKVTEQFNQSKYVQQYHKDNIRQIRLTLNQRTEQDLIDWIEAQSNMQGYIKQLIRTDMEKQNHNYATSATEKGSD